MTDFPPFPLRLDDRSNLAISSWSGWSLGPAAQTSSFAGTAWPAANDALFVPFRVPIPVTVYKMACGTGTLTTGNFDLGIYDAFGNRLVSSGSTAKTTASSERIVDITDTFLLPGLYYLAMATNGTENYIFGSAFPHVGCCNQLGVRRMGTAFALPTTATYATYTALSIPCIAAYLRPE